MAQQSDWKKTTGIVTNVYRPNPIDRPTYYQVSVQAVNPVTGQQQTFNSSVVEPGKGLFGLDADVTHKMRKGQQVEVQMETSSLVALRRWGVQTGQRASEERAFLCSEVGQFGLPIHEKDVVRWSRTDGP